MDRNSLPPGWTLARVREVGGLANDPRLLNAADSTATVETREGVQPLDPLVIIDCGGLCLVLHDDGDWYMGQPDAQEVIRCWGSYGSELDGALRGL